ncbi:MAG: NTE family protein [bacterium P3]|nr:MAG: NTE family protein [bacterium P3]KWW40935.1 MAG: NTE family protein [bacterium F083]
MPSPHDFETRSIPRLLWAYAMPAIVGQLISSIYNIADRVILGQYVGPMAIAGLAITLPVMNIIHAFGSLVGAGSSARMSIVLGRKDLPWAEKILGNSMLLTFFFGFFFVAGGYLFMNPLLSAFGASPDTIAYARQYMNIVLPGMFLTTLTFNLTGLIRASGHPTKSMWILVGGALLNILLDLLFIPLLHLGIAGAAWATTVSMTVAALFSVLHFIPSGGFRCFRKSGDPSRQPTVLFRRHAWVPRPYIIRNILAIGVSPFLMNLAASGVAVVINRQLLRYGGDLAVGTYGIINSASLIVFLLMMGICQGMQPIAGYNYGAGHTHRLRQVYRLTMAVCLLTGLLGTLACCCFPRLILRCFTTDATLISIGIPAMRYLTVMFPLIAFTVINSQFFQSIDKPWIAIVTSLSRQVLFLVPMMFLVPLLFVRSGADGLTGVWFSCTLSDIFGALLSAILFYSQRAVFRPGYVAPDRGPRKSHTPSGTAAALTLALLLTLAAPAKGQVGQMGSMGPTAPVSSIVSTVPVDTVTHAPRIGLVLGGGGAKGASHIGVLRYLEDHGIPVHCVVGTSMGAIIGGFYALGYNARQLDTIISRIDWSYYLSGSVGRAYLPSSSRQRTDRLLFTVPFSFRSPDSVGSTLPSSFVGGSNLTNLFANLSVGYTDSCSFDSLPIPFACVATDLRTGGEVVLRSGCLPMAIRASMAIPGVFAPVVLDTLLLADGGMVNNFPADICRAMGADIVIGVEVGDELVADPSRLRTLPQLVSQLMSIVVSAKTSSNRQLCDIYIRPDISGYHILSFNPAAVDTLVRRGYEAAVLAFAGRPAPAHPAGGRSRRRAVNLYADTILLSSVNLIGAPVSEQPWLLRKTGLDKGLPVTAADLDRAVEILTATGAWRDITYRVHRTGLRGDTLAVLGLPNRYDTYRLDISLQPEAPHTFGLGFRYDSEESASILLDLGLRRNRFAGAKLDLRARLSYNPRLYAAGSLSGFALGNLNLDYRYGRTDYTLTQPSGLQQHIDYDDHRFRLYLSDYSLLRFSLSGGLSHRLIHYRSLLGDTADLPSHHDNGTLTLFLHARYDNLDAPLLATRGSLVSLAVSLNADTAAGSLPSFRHSRWGDITLHAATHLTPGGGPVTLVPALAMRWLVTSDTPHRSHRNLVGGVMPGRYVDHQLPFLGLLAPHVVGDAALILRCDLRLRLGRHHLSLIGNYLYHTPDLEHFMRFDPSDLRGQTGAALRYAYTTRFGPVSLDLAASTLHPTPQLYLSFGHNF